jgi:hypothetical protein
MGQPTWRTILAKFDVPSVGGILWTNAIDFVPGGTTLKISVEPGSEWTPEGCLKPCSADGEMDQVLSQATLAISGVPRGALIGRIGGSSADQTLDAASAATTNQSPRMFLFAIGRFCVVQIPANTSGALFLGMNDAASGAAKASGSIKVNVAQAL